MKTILKNKKGLIFKNAIFAIVAMSLAIIAVGVWVDAWNTSYDSGLDYDLGDLDKLDKVSAYASGAREDVTVRGSFDTGTGDFEGTTLRGAFSIINNIFTPFEVVFGSGGLISTIQDRFGIPNYIIIALVTFFIVAIIWGLVALLTRRPSTTA